MMELTCKECDRTVRFSSELVACAAGWREDERKAWTCGTCTGEAEKEGKESPEMELAPGGYAELNERIETLERLANAGILNPDAALESCRKIRQELYGLLQTLQRAVILTPAA
jgi:hypothetical protein